PGTDRDFDDGGDEPVALDGCGNDSGTDESAGAGCSDSSSSSSEGCEGDSTGADGCGGGDASGCSGAGDTGGDCRIAARHVTHGHRGGRALGLLLPLACVALIKRWRRRG